MPALEMAQENGKLLAWRKKEGERVQKGEPLLEIETDKAVVEVESPGDGLLAGVTAQVGAVIPVGQNDRVVGRRRGRDRRRKPHPRLPLLALLTPPSGPPRLLRTSESTPWPHPRRKFHLKRGVSPRNWAWTSAVCRGLARAASSRPKTCNRSLIPSETATPAPPAASQALSQVARLMAERTTQSWTSVPHFFPGARRGCRRANERTEEAQRRRWPSAGRPRHAHRFADRCARPNLGQASAVEFKLDRRGNSPESRCQHQLGRGREGWRSGCGHSQGEHANDFGNLGAADGFRRTRPRWASAPCGYFRRNVHSQQSGHVQSRCVQCHHHAAAGCRFGRRRDQRSRGSHGMVSRKYVP